MSGERYIKQAFIASLCDHPDQEKYRARAFSEDNMGHVINLMSSGGKGISKADFFAADENGKFIIDTPGFWQNFEKVLDIITRNGEKFTMDDFLRPLGRESSTLLESARTNNSFGKIFTEEVWLGRFDEMERLWYRVPIAFRRELFKQEGFIDINMKRRMLAEEGKKPAEDGLAAAGITRAEFFAVFRERGNYEDMTRKLAAKGDCLRKDYVLLLDDEGNTLFAHESSWTKYQDVVKAVEAGGERFEVADFIRKVGTRPNILMRASEKNTLHLIFTAEHWADRLTEMLDLWSYVKEGWKSGTLKTEDFDNAYANAESLTYGKLVDYTAIISKQDLLTPINAGTAVEKPVLPIGLRTFWDNLPVVEKQLADKGEKITLNDLRLKTGEMENSCLMNAAKFGHFDKIVSFSRQGGGQIMLDDFLSKDRHGKTLLNILAERKELGLAFSPDLWAGRVNDMKALWSHIRSSDRGQVNIEQAEIAAKQATLRQQAKNKFKL